MDVEMQKIFLHCSVIGEIRSQNKIKQGNEVCTDVDGRLRLRSRNRLKSVVYFHGKNPGMCSWSVAD